MRASERVFRGSLSLLDLTIPTYLYILFFTFLTAGILGFFSTFFSPQRRFFFFSLLSIELIFRLYKVKCMNISCTLNRAIFVIFVILIVGLGVILNGYRLVLSRTILVFSITLYYVLISCEIQLSWGEKKKACKQFRALRKLECVEFQSAGSIFKNRKNFATEAR